MSGIIEQYKCNSDTQTERLDVYVPNMIPQHIKARYDVVCFRMMQVDSTLNTVLSDRPTVQKATPTYFRHRLLKVIMEMNTMDRGNTSRDVFRSNVTDGKSMNPGQNLDSSCKTQHSPTVTRHWQKVTNNGASSSRLSSRQLLRNTIVIEMNQYRATTAAILTARNRKVSPCPSWSIDSVPVRAILKIPDLFSCVLFMIQDKEEQAGSKSEANMQLQTSGATYYLLYDTNMTAEFRQRQLKKKKYFRSNSFTIKAHLHKRETD